MNAVFVCEIAVAYPTSVSSAETAVPRLDRLPTGALRMMSLRLQRFSFTNTKHSSLW